MKRLALFSLIAISVLLALACSLTSGIPTEEIRRRAIAILGEEVEEELVRDFIVVTPLPTLTTIPTPLSCINPVSFGTYHLSVFNDQSGAADDLQYAYGPPDDQSTHWEGNSDVTRYWSYSLANVISGMITHTLVYTPDGTATTVDLYVHRERLVSVDEPGWVRVCSGQWSCSFSAEVGSLMYALSAAGGVQIDGAVLELSNGCEYADVEVVAATIPTLTPTSTPTATVESSSETAPTAEPDEVPTDAPTDSAPTVPPPVAASPTLPLPTVLPSPTVPLPSPTVPLPSPTVPPPSPTAPPSSPPKDTATPVLAPQVVFSAASYSVAENGSLATITVILNKTSPVTVTVDFATSNGTATAGSDYTASSGTLTFSSGQTSLSFPVPILGDGSVEGDETLNLTLSSPGNATLGVPSAATLTIVDDDVPTVQFSSATYSVDEFAGTATITVTLNVAPLVAASVNYATSDGTATLAGSDYTNTSGTLPFAVGQTVGTFTIPINNDTTLEQPDETVNLSLSAPVNVTLGTPNTAVLTIIDDDLGRLYVSSLSTNQILVYNGTTGAFIGVFASGGGLNQPTGLIFGPDSNLYVSSEASAQVLRYNGTTGAFIGVFASGGGLTGPNILDFRSGNLYVSNPGSSQVLRYNGTTGAPLGVFASGGGLTGPRGLVFGPDGNLYVAGVSSNNVVRYNGTTGAFIDVFASGSGLSAPDDVVFGPDNNLYVASEGSDEVLRYNGTTGAFIDVFASGGGLNGPTGLTFGPDGNLYVSSGATDQILRYNGTTGAFIGIFASGGGLNFPIDLVFGP